MERTAVAATCATFIAMLFYSAVASFVNTVAADSSIVVVGVTQFAYTRAKHCNTYLLGWLLINLRSCKDAEFNKSA